MLPAPTVSYLAEHIVMQAVAHPIRLAPPPVEETEETNEGDENE